jgi:PPK2 family polyphosphate:nucleotide phosphotransferase
MKHAHHRLLESYRVPTDHKRFCLRTIDPDDKGDFSDKADAVAEYAREIGRLVELQEVLYAERRHAMLVVLQAMDTGGKDGVVNNVFGPLNNQGVTVTSFKRPTLPEQAHDYLWRVHQAVPPAGSIGVFNRSHYEDVLVARVHDLVPKETVEARYRQISAFEEYLTQNGVTILKFFLHISKDEQKKRLQSRLADPTKQWKFDPADLVERKAWEKYLEAYEIALGRCSTQWAPWFVVPANRKWYRNLVIARILRHTLETLRLRYPKAPEGIGQLEIVE